MNYDYFFIGAYIALPILTALITYFIRNILSRIEMLETKIETKISEQESRQIMNDKIDPIREDLSEIKDSIRKLFDLYYKQNK